MTDNDDPNFLRGEYLGRHVVRVLRKHVGNVYPLSKEVSLPDYLSELVRQFEKAEAKAKARRDAPQE
jgi:hypothetical protein